MGRRVNQTLYKLTSPIGTTKRNTPWTPRVWNTIDADLQEPRLCSTGVFHAYTSREQALLLASIHTYGDAFLLWSAQAPSIAVQDGTKAGVYALRVLRQLPLPTWYTDRAQLTDVALLTLCNVLAAVLRHTQDTLRFVPGSPVYVAQQRRFIRAVRSYVATHDKAALNAEYDRLPVGLTQRFYCALVDVDDVAHYLRLAVRDLLYGATRDEPVWMAVLYAVATGCNSALALDALASQIPEPARLTLVRRSVRAALRATQKGA